MLWTSRICLAAILGCAASAATADTADDADEFTATLGEDGLVISSRDGSTKIEIGGRLHADLSRHGGETPLTDADDGTNVTRARLELGGTFQQDWRWAAETDFAGNEVELKDFTLGYAGLDVGTLTVGHQKQPYSLALEMSSNDIPWMERSIDNFLIVPFVDRAVGARLDTSSERWFAAAGVYGHSSSSSLPSDEGWGASGRFVFAPLLTDDRVVHIGVRMAHRVPDTVDGTLRLRDETTDHSGLSIVDTGPITGVDDVTLYGPEFAAAFGRTLIYAEYNKADVARSAADSLDFDSWHVSVSWAPGGETRAESYEIDAGEFKRLKPSRNFRLGQGGGTWELKARYAALDLNSGSLIGGREEAVTVGANWHANANVRFMLDWTHIVDTDGSSAARRAAEDLDVLSLRAQYAF